jgi:hypothetical protein
VLGCVRFRVSNNNNAHQVEKKGPTKQPEAPRPRTGTCPWKWLRTRRFGLQSSLQPWLSTGTWCGCPPRLEPRRTGRRRSGPPVSAFQERRLTPVQGPHTATQRAHSATHAAYTPPTRDTAQCGPQHRMVCCAGEALRSLRCTGSVRGAVNALRSVTSVSMCCAVLETWLAVLRSVR